MNNLNRRRFFQAASGALGAIALTQIRLSQQTQQYGRVLAQSTPRKVALLIGVNSYSRGNLRGALTDIELQKQLLIHRFGFNPADIHTLREEQATRQNILGAFNEYLYKPAQSGDVVVFHFSGHGKRVYSGERLPEFTRQVRQECFSVGSEGDCYNTTIAPFDHEAGEAETVQDIMGHTLLLMRAGLAKITDNATFVLDCCYAGGGKRGNAIMRSLNQSAEPNAYPQISDNEWQYQREWLDLLGWSPDDFATAIQAPTGQGFFLGAAKASDYAADYAFNGFTAGAFTYLLTQSLWQTGGSLASTFANVTNSTRRLRDNQQTPEYDPHPSAQTKPVYHLASVSLPAEAVILGQKEGTDRVFLWLGGLDPQRLEAFDQGAVFSVVHSRTGVVLGEMQQVDGTREELVSEGKFISNDNQISPQDLAGYLLQEKTRGIPEKVMLKIALDDTLTAVEQQQAITALSSPNFEVSIANPGEDAHILLGRYNADIAQAIDRQVAEQIGSKVGSIGLFSPTQVPVLNGSFGPVDETVEQAIARLNSRFVSLHISRMLALMVNGSASPLHIDVSVKHADSTTLATTRGGNPTGIQNSQHSAAVIEQISLGNPVSVSIENKATTDLHFGLLAIDSAGAVAVLFPTASDDPNHDVIARGSSKTEDLTAVEPKGIVELLVLASPQSLVGPLTTLSRSVDRLSRGERGDSTTAPEVMADIFGVLDIRRSQPVDTIKGPRLLDVEEVAVLSLMFEIVS